MSTRTMLKERRNFFKMQIKHEGYNEAADKVIKEIDFILEKLRSEYDNNGHNRKKEDRTDNGFCLEQSVRI